MSRREILQRRIEARQKREAEHRKLLQRLQDLHSVGLKDAQLAKQLNISLASVKRYRKELGLGSVCPRNNLGKRGEVLVAQKLTELGFNAEVKLSGCPYDVSALMSQPWYTPELRIEVKTRTQRIGEDYWRFTFPPVRNSYHCNYQYPKDYTSDSDFTVMVGVPRGIPHELLTVNDVLFWIAKPEELAENIALHPSGKMFERWELLLETQEKSGKTAFF